MASSYEPPDFARLDELERLAAAVAEELASWRRRCLTAEAELNELKSRAVGYVVGEAASSRQRVSEIEKENLELERRITTAREQIEQLRTRLRFVEGRTTGERS